MKTLKSLLRLASYHWWAYNKCRQMESEPTQEREPIPKSLQGVIFSPVVGGEQYYVKLRCNHCGQVSLKTAPPKADEIYNWCSCGIKNRYIKDGSTSFMDIGGSRSLILAKWHREGKNESD